MLSFHLIIMVIIYLCIYVIEEKYWMHHEFACHPCAEPILVFSISFRFWWMCCRSEDCYYLLKYSWENFKILKHTTWWFDICVHYERGNHVNICKLVLSHLWLAFMLFKFPLRNKELKEFLKGKLMKEGKKLGTTYKK